MNEAKQALESFRSYKGEAFKSLPVVIYDTVLLGASAGLVPVDLFLNDGKVQQYRNEAFPNQSGAYLFTHISVVHTLRFSDAAVTTMSRTLKYFYEHSSLNFQIENQVYEPIMLSELVEETILPNPFSVATIATLNNYRHRDKFASKYKLDQPIPVPAGKKFTPKFTPATGLTTAADDATNSDYLPGSGLSNSRGHKIMFRLHGFKITESVVAQ